MAFKHSTVTVGTTPTSLVAGVADTEFNPGRSQEVGRSILLSEPSGTLYIGAEDVTTEDYGYKVAAGGEISLDLLPGDVPYAVAASGTVTVRALHMGV